MTLPQPYRIESMDWSSLWTWIKPLQSKMFTSNLRVPTYMIISPEEIENIKRLRQNMGSPFNINLGLFYEDELVGWSYGWQENQETYYMTNSAVLAEHRRKGLYTALLNKTIEIAKEK